MPFEGFIYLSLHPIKLLMTILPQFFGSDVWSAFIETGCTSGMDAELIMGAAAVCLLLASLSLAKKQFHVKYMAGLFFASLLYACMGHIPLLAKIFYHIPILNLFRVPSRTLFLFTFASIVLIACSMDALIRDAQYYKKIHRVNLWMIGVLAGAAILYDSALLSYGGERLSIEAVFAVPCILFAFYLLAFYGIYFFEPRGIRALKWKYAVVPVLVAGFTIVQVMPYYSQAYISNIQANLALPDQLIEEVGSYKVWTPDSSCSELSSNSSQTYHIQGINGYLNWNLPNLYKYLTSSPTAPMNGSGMYNSISDPESILSEKNDVLSMLGVKYIMVSPERDLSQYTARKDVNTLGVLLSAGEVDLAPGDGYQIAAWPVTVGSNSYYQIQLTLSAEYSGDEFYVDFYSANSEFQQPFLLTMQAGTHEYSAILPSGDGEQGEDVYFRIVALTMQNLNVTNVQVSEVSFDGEPLYGLFAEQTGYNIYENQFAKELIYAPERVIPIRTEDVSLLYTQTASYDLLNTSYLTNGENECDFSQTDVSITDIQLKNNSASAQVTADGDCFLNFSQTYYPGWNAYVDGDQVELYEVNGLIQGIFVPAGTHVVEFRFQPIVFYIGCGISLLTVMACVLYGVFEKRKHRILK